MTNPSENIELETKIKQRGGYRAYVTKVINNISDIFENYTSDHDTRLQTFKQTLKKKLLVLKDLNDQIIAKLPLEDIEDEIFKSSELFDEIREVLINTKFHHLALCQKMLLVGLLLFHRHQHISFTKCLSC